VAGTASGNECTNGRERDREELEQQLHDPLAGRKVTDQRREQPQLGHHQGGSE
jgi:hypothetical protein